MKLMLEQTQERFKDNRTVPVLLFDSADKLTRKPILREFL